MLIRCARVIGNGAYLIKQLSCGRSEMLLLLCGNRFSRGIALMSYNKSFTGKFGGDKSLRPAVPQIPGFPLNSTITASDSRDLETGRFFALQAATLFAPRL